MLTADLVHTRRRGDELFVVPLKDDERPRALALCTAIVGVIEGHVGRTRGELDTALSAIPATAKERRLKDALVKLALDRCEIDAGPSEAAPSLRKLVFTRAAEARRSSGLEFDREAVLEEAAREAGLDVESLEASLFADLREAHKIQSFERISASALLDAYGPAQAQAVLLRAVKVVAEVKVGSALAARELFRRLKFQRLLFVAEKTKGGLRLTVDGPFSVFESITKYGLAFAMVLPALEGCDRFRLEAEVRWGKERRPLTYRLEGGARRAGNKEVPLPDEVGALLRAWEGGRAGWTAAPNLDVLDLPGVGLSVPDLVFEKDGTKVYLEVMGYWSRDAVWKRVELVQKGLSARVVFAVSSRLRVREDVLGEDLPSALYVYKGALNARAIEERLDALAKR